MAGTHESFMEERYKVFLMLYPDVGSNKGRGFNYKSINECMEGICKLYEEHLKKQDPNVPIVPHDRDKLFDFVELTNMLCLITNPSFVYIPHNKNWIKENLDIFIKRAAEHEETL
ncbi:enhancer of rudimentary homolog isoform X2 [Solenopsis invicta]|uniref:enhancer of rudimentary homolog isoform X2 n=1 Tax=Solenopsis invicta TaxID=13686 RepID=UPI00193CDCFC|nr:enhancer of rudimentary homolog isoform X2 [Solenopsis invicta]